MRLYTCIIANARHRGACELERVNVNKYYRVANMYETKSTETKYVAKHVELIPCTCMMYTYGLMVILIMVMLLSLCLLSAAFTEGEEGRGLSVC